MPLVGPSLRGPTSTSNQRSPRTGRYIFHFIFFKLERYLCLQSEGVLTCGVCVSKRVSVLEGFKITSLVFVLCNLWVIT